MEIIVNPPSVISVTAVPPKNYDISVLPGGVYDVDVIPSQSINVQATTTGASGLSAYEIWLGEGNIGTEQDFLNYIGIVECNSASEETIAFNNGAKIVIRKDLL
jgi:hypothetical protein